jgi:hypothetical protein
MSSFIGQNANVTNIEPITARLANEMRFAKNKEN